MSIGGRGIMILGPGGGNAPIPLSPNAVVRVPEDFSAIQGALLWASNQVVTPNSRLLVELSPGVHYDKVEVSNTDLSFVTISGTPPYVFEAVGNDFVVDGNPGSWIVRFDVLKSDLPEVEPGDYVSIYPTSTSINKLRAALAGTWEITNVLNLDDDTWRIILDVPIWITFGMADPEIPVKVVKWNTTLYHDGDAPGSNPGHFRISGCKGPGLVNFVMVADLGNSANAISLLDGAEITLPEVEYPAIAAIKFARGIRAIDSTFRGKISVSQCSTHGIMCEGGSRIASDGLFLSGNEGSGILVSENSEASISTNFSSLMSITAGNGENGVRAIYGARVYLGSFLSWDNAYEDLSANSSSTIVLSQSDAEFDDSTPAVNTVGNGNSYICQPA